MTDHYYNIILNFALLDINKLQILGMKPALFYYIIFSGIFIICYLLIQPFIALLVARHTVNLLTYLMCSLLLIISCLLLIQLSYQSPLIFQGFHIENESIIIKNVLLAIGTLGVVIAGFYYVKHLLNIK